MVREFGGATFLSRSPAEGVWSEDARTVQRDEIILLEVMVPSIQKSWWDDLRGHLETEFHQQEIVIRGAQISLL